MNNPFDTNFVIAEGDWGGQIYFTIPKNLIHKDAQVIELTVFVDKHEWNCNEGSGFNVYEMNPRSDFLEYGKEIPDYPWNSVSGGMGGGELIEDGVWIHPDISKSLVEKIKSHLLFGISVF